MAYKVHETSPTGFPAPLPSGSVQVKIEDTKTGNWSDTFAGTDRNQVVRQAADNLYGKNLESSGSGKF